jgi:carbon monoxide dehydrogenase subunit G
MKVSGAATVHASPDAVLAALADSGLLVRALPCLDQLDGADGSRRFLGTIAIAAVRGSYAGEAVVVARPQPHRLVLRVTAAGAKGAVEADLTVTLAPSGDGATELGYAADAAVEGAIAGIGQLMLVSIARRLAADVIGGLDAALLSAAPPEALPGPQDPPAAVGPARRGIGSRGDRQPAIGRPATAVRTRLLAGGAVGLAGVVLGVVLRWRSRRRGR